jgi:sucrose-6-phosphate hydrolase SacC (GH32 family)
MTVPRQLTLRKTVDGLRLVQKPIDALKQLRRPYQPGSDTLDLDSTIPLGNAKEVGWKLLTGDNTVTMIGYDGAQQMLFVDRSHSGDTSFSKDFAVRTTAPLRIQGNQLRLRILIDHCSLEVFAEDGRIAMTNLVFPPQGGRSIQFFSTGGQAGPPVTERWSLNSIW